MTPPTCDPKVSQLDVPIPVDQDVACLDVSMDVPIAVDVRQRAQHLRREGRGGGRARRNAIGLMGSIPSSR